MSKVRIAIPNMGNICDDTMASVIAMVTGQNLGHYVIFDHSKRSPIDNNRNAIVDWFLKTDEEYLLFIDSIDTSQFATYHQLVHFRSTPENRRQY